MEACDLCIIGAGYAGVNAFNAACKYLPKGARVVVVAQQSRWGGQWVEQYEFVRLHQAYPLYTAGEREWSFSGKKPWSYLATKKEILQHFEEIVEANVSEKELDLVTLFQYQYNGYSVEDGKVQLVVKSLLHQEGVAPPPVTIRADKMIIATGLIYFQELSKKGFFHSYVADAQNFVAGIASKEEIETCKATLTPATERILKCHLIDIEESSEAGLRMKLRSLDGQTVDYRPLERGSFIVNCTDNVLEGQLDIQPIISDDGLVLATQNPLRHSGLSPPTPEWLARLKECQDLIAKRHETMEKARYTDKVSLSTRENKDVLGGNIGRQRS